MTPTRRGTLRAVLAVVVAATAGRPRLAAAASPAGLPDSAAVIGRAYLREHGAERFDADQCAVGDTSGTLSARIEADFARGDVVMVSGWMLSRTEAVACARMALGGPAAGQGG